MSGLEWSVEATLAQLARDLTQRGVDFSTPAAAEEALRSLQAEHEGFHVCSPPSPQNPSRQCRHPPTAAADQFVTPLANRPPSPDGTPPPSRTQRLPIVQHIQSRLDTALRLQVPKRVNEEISSSKFLMSPCDSPAPPGTSRRCDVPLLTFAMLDRQAEGR